MKIKGFSDNALEGKLPLGRAIFWIFLSTLLISGSVVLGWLYYLHLHAARSNDDAFRIVAIVQTCPNKETLQTVYLAQLMDLAVDHPTNLYRFDKHLAEQKLKASPVIKRAVVKTIRPGIVHVDYEVREPIAALHDYSNTAIDEEGYIFPIVPFFTPKKLPEIYLGLPAFGQKAEKPGGLDGGQWGVPLKGKELELALSLLDLLVSNSYRDLFSIRWIDVSNACADSYGQREIVLAAEDSIEKVHGDTVVLQVHPRELRLSTKNYCQELGNYLELRKKLLEKELSEMPIEGEQLVQRSPPMTIDLRIPQLAFIDYQDEK